MKMFLLILSLLSGFLNPAFAKSAKAKTTKSGAANNIVSNFHSSAFSEARVTNSQELELQASDSYLTGSDLQKKTWISEAYKNWQDSGHQKQNQMITVVSNNGGELWTSQSDKLTKISEWSDNRLFIPETTVATGRWFAFFGGQVTTGGPADITGFNARVGSTLLQNRYDIALTVSYASINTTPSVNTSSFGVIGRALFPLSEHVGYNLGGQLVHTDVDGNSENTPGAVAGLNFFIPNGSFDITVSAIDAGRWSLLAGYTLFFDRR